MKPGPQALHLVQIGFDATIFDPSAASDTFDRQIFYLDHLQQKCPGSRSTLLVLTNTEAAARQTSEGFMAIPVRGRGFQLRWNLLSAILDIHRHYPVHLLSPQTIFDDGLVALAAGRMIGVPVVGQIHVDIFQPEAISENLGPGIIGKLRYQLALKAVKHYAALRTVSSMLQEAVEKQHLHAHVRTIPVPVTMAATKQARNTARLPQVVFVGRLVEAKHLQLWLSVAKRVLDEVPDAQFIIVGDGPLRAELIQLARKLEIQDSVRFVGQMSYGSLAAIYQQSSVFLLTSLNEGFGRVLVEAGLQQLPAVATKTAGALDIIEHEKTGFLHTHDDESGIAQSVVKLLLNTDQAQEMGLAAQERVQRLFDPTRLAQEWISFLIEIANARQQA